MSQPSASSSKPASTSNGPSADDIEKLLNREANAFQREMEVERILKAFKLKYVPPLLARGMRTHIIERSPYEILDISEEATVEEVKKKYRQLSLCEHPPAAPWVCHSSGAG